MDAKHALEMIRAAERRSANGLAYLRKHYPFLFMLALMAGVTLLVLGFAAGFSEAFKATYAICLERIISAAFGAEKVAAAKIAGEAIKDAAEL